MTTRKRGGQPTLVTMVRFHSHGVAWCTYRIGDGRGGAGFTTRFAPLMRPDNVNRQSPPVALADQAEIWQENLMGRPHDFAGNVAFGIDGFKTFGFSGSRPDVWEPEGNYWDLRAPGWRTSGTRRS